MKLFDDLDNLIRTRVLEEIKVGRDLIINVGSFRLVLDGERGKKIPESSRIKFLVKISINNFALLDAKDNTSKPCNSRGIADLNLLRTLLANRQNPR